MAADTSWLPGSSRAVPPASNPSGLCLDMGQLQVQVCALKTPLAAWDALELQADRQDFCPLLMLSWGQGEERAKEHRGQ